MRGTTVLFPLLLDCVKGTEPGVAGGSKDHICAFADLSKRELFSFARIVPRRVSDADIILDHTNVGIHRLRSFFIPLGETMNQTNVHAPEKADCSRSRSLCSENANEVRTFMFFED